MAIPVGSKAPDFTLKSKQPAGLVDVKLSNNFGKKNTVLLFVPAAFTSVCTQELCDITSGLNTYQGLNADVIGISVDSPFAQDAWAQKDTLAGGRPDCRLSAMASGRMRCSQYLCAHQVRLASFWAKP